MAGNPKLGNISIYLSNDETHDSLINITIDLFVTIKEMIVAVCIKLPEDDSDIAYRRVFVRSTINVNRFFKDMKGSFLVKAMGENFLKSLDFEPKFPLTPVKTVKSVTAIIFMNLCFQRVYRFINFSVSDKFIPLFGTTKGLVSLRFMGKVSDRLSFQHFVSMEFFGELQRNNSKRN